jgi:hypothetical protein
MTAEKTALVDALMTALVAARDANEQLREFERTTPNSGAPLTFAALSSQQINDWLSRVDAVRAGTTTV